ncbi:MAG TPA: hypothetical protein VKT32_00855, partial [Chthonomonadaceae bacterium]|nr:hypothetical protein [Chthonomonadaceae bacterium]
QAVMQLHVPEAEDREISVSIGLHGGRRTRERDPIHYTATLNNLINLASQDCTRRKEMRRLSVGTAGGAGEERLRAGDYGVAPEATGGVGGRVFSEPPARQPGHRSLEDIEPGAALRLSAVEVSWTGEVAHVHVLLEAEMPPERGSAGENSLVLYEGSLSQASDEAALPLLVARTTALALRRSHPASYDLIPEEILQAQTGEGRTLLTLIGRLDTPSGSRPVLGSAFVGQDRLYAVAQAVLAADPLNS